MVGFLHFVELQQVITIYLGYDEVQLSACCHMAHDVALGIAAYLLHGRMAMMVSSSSKEKAPASL